MDFPALLAVWALWLAVGQHDFVWGEMVGQEVASLGVF